MLQGKKIGFIGGGQIAEAIVSGLVKSGGIQPQDIWVTDYLEERLQYLQKQYGISVLQNNSGADGAKKIAIQSDILLLAVKPQVARTLLESIQTDIKQHSLVVSVMGGVSLALIEEHIQANPVVRVMPNTPMWAGKGAAGIAAGKNASVQDTELIQALFSLVGRAYVVPEKWIDPLTGVSGCGPAFGYMFIEALADGGVEQGLPRDLALQLAAQTLAGAAEMVLQTGRHPAELKDSVCSPGGSTIAGVHALEANAFRASVMDAVECSCEKMNEVGKKA